MKTKSLVKVSRLFFAILVVMAQFTFPVMPVHGEEVAQESHF